MSLSSQPVPFELDILREGVRYQKWVVDVVRPFLGARILEVGAGIGNLSRWLPVRELLVASEADDHLVPKLTQTLSEQFQNDPRVRSQHVQLAGGAWVEQAAVQNFDTVVSFNVLEHIEDDESAFKEFVKLLRLSRATGPKRIVTFVPAHAWAYGSVDKGYDHFRRYSRGDLRRLASAAAPEAKIWMRHFNLPGLPGWIWLGQVKKQKELGRKSVMAFERVEPLIRPLDKLLGEKLRLPFGQSILCVVTLND